MASVNKVMMLGRLTRDPELRYTPKGTAVCDLGVALNRTWTDPGGEKKEEVTFVDVTAWSRTAELCAQYLKKGRQVFIEGRLKLDQWEQEGAKKSKLTVVADQVTFVDGGQGGAGGGREYSSEGSEGGGGGARRSGGYQQRGPSSNRGPQRPANPPADSDGPPPDEAPPSHMEGDPPF